MVKQNKNKKSNGANVGFKVLGLIYNKKYYGKAKGF